MGKNKKLAENAQDCSVDLTNHKKASFGKNFGKFFFHDFLYLTRRSCFYAEDLEEEYGVGHEPLSGCCAISFAFLIAPIEVVVSPLITMESAARALYKTCKSR